MFFCFPVLLLLMGSTRCEDEGKDIGAIYTKLRQDLLRHYDKHARPVLYNSNVTKVIVTMDVVSTFEIDEVAQTINIDSYMSMRWNDHHLTWKPEDYENIRVLQLATSEVWMPDIYELRNGGPTSDMQQSDFSVVILLNRGIVYWFFATVMPGRCKFDYSNYPNDLAECEIKLQAWSFKGDAIDIDAEVFFMNYDEFPKNPNPQWEFTGVSAKRVIWESKIHGSYPSALFTITLARKSPTQQQQLIWIGSVIVVLLTLGMFWIPSDIEQKVTVGCVTMIIMTAILLTVVSSVPERQLVIKIAGTLHSLMFVVTAAILLEIIAINLQHIQEWQPPEVLLNIFSGTIGRILLISSAQQEKPSVDKMKLSEYEGGDAMFEQLITKGNWKTLSQALDRILFLIFVVILSAVPKTP